MENEFPKRKNMRMQGFDYSKSGAYHITICTKHREKILWKDSLCYHPEDWKSNLSEIGQIVDRQINDYNGHKEITVDKYVIMPDHVHLLVFVDDHKAECQITVTERPAASTERPAAFAERPAAVPCTTGATGYRTGYAIEHCT